MENKEFKTDEIEVSVQLKPFCHIEMEVKVLPPLLEKARAQAFKEVKKEVELPGFRKGKAPDEIVLQKHQSDVEKHTGKVIADLSFNKAFQLAKIPLLGNDSPINYNLKSRTENEAVLSFSYETDPEVPSVSLENFTPPTPERTEITDKEISEALRQARFFHASWKPVEDRPISENDFVILDLESMETDPPQKVFSDIRFEMKEKSIALWMKELLIGARTGDVIEGTSHPDDHLSEKEKKEFAPKKVRVTIKKVEEADLPPEDEELAKKMGAASLAELREKVKEMLNNMADEKVEKTKKEAVDEFLLKNYKFDLPSSVMSAEINHRKSQILQNPESKERFDKMDKKGIEQFEAELYKQSDDALRLFYLARKIVQDAKIEISEAEIDEEAMRIVSRSRPHEPLPDKSALPKEAFALAVSKVLLKRARNYILGQKT